jgi:peptidoglycan/LPS O-acetylase OafA/YrhL
VVPEIGGGGQVIVSADLDTPCVSEAPPKAPENRLLWLDALRGLAVIGVVIDHGTGLVFPELHNKVLTPWFDIGTCGVFVFFLVSGYIVPASLERHGSVRRFWTGRMFRLYPVWALAMAVRLLFGFTGIMVVDPNMTSDPVAWSASHVTMLQDLLGVKNTLGVLWTLSYEMAFYLVLTGLFIVGAHRRSAATAVTLAAAAVVLGGILPQEALSSGGSATRWVAVTAAGTLVVGVLCAMGQARAARLAGAVLLAGLSITLVTVNGRTGAWEGLLIPAIMFTGTAIYRAEQRQTGWKTTLAVAVSVTILAVVSGVYHSREWLADPIARRDFQQSWTIAVLVAVTIFAVGFFYWRTHRPPPTALIWLGTISYSLYLLHPLALNIGWHLFGEAPNQLSFVGQCLVGAAFVASILAAGWASHRWVEKPAQRLGRRVAKALDARRDLRPVPVASVPR